MSDEDRPDRLGTWLFRWRTYLPVPLFGLVLLGLRGARYPAGRHVLALEWAILCLGGCLVGLLIRALAVGCAPAGTSGRNTRGHVADSLTTTGMYSIVRHPLYLGNYFVWLGVALLPRAWWVPLLITLIFALIHQRIIGAEEAFLQARFGEPYREWVRRTPALIPALGRWAAPGLPFSWRTVVRREYHALLGLTLAFAGFELIQDRVIGGRFQLDPRWMTFWGLVAALYLVLRLLVKRTTLLDAPGR